MARSWHHAKDRLRCGGDVDCWVAKGEPYLLLAGEGWQKARCVKHSPYAVPDVIDEPRPLSQRTPSSFTPAKELAKVLPRGLRLDAKVKQTGEGG